MTEDVARVRSSLIRDLSRKAADDVDRVIEASLRLAYHDGPEVAISIALSGAIAALERTARTMPRDITNHVQSRAVLFAVAALLAGRTNRGDIVRMEDLADSLFTASILVRAAHEKGVIL